MIIRHASLNDLDAVTALEQEAFPAAEAASKESMKRRLELDGGMFWLLEDGGRLLSFINAMPSNEYELCDSMYHDSALYAPGGEWMMILSVATSVSKRGAGCASRVMRKVIDDSRAQGRRGLVLACKQGLIGFYERFGFENEGLSESSHGGAKWYEMRLVF